MKLLQNIIYQIKQKQSYLCVGLDTVPTKIPLHLRKQKDGILLFNKAIIDATADFCISYKLNTAFYEALGAQGWDIMEETLAYIPKHIFTIADAKRGDISSSSAQYAKAFFETLRFDAITVSPYMGFDSIEPFLKYPNKMVIMLALTSNASNQDFQQLKIKNSYLFENVIKTSQLWPRNEKLMYVVGATNESMFKKIRKSAPDSFLLVPGVGAQGGDLRKLSKAGMNSQCGLIVNSSRSIIYAASGKNFAKAAREKAKEVQLEMKILLEEL